MSVTSQQTITTYNPANGALIREYPVTTPAELAAMTQRAREVQAIWGETPLKTRAKVLKTAAALLHQRSEAVAAVISEETGKSLLDALEADIGSALNTLTYYAALGPKRLKPRRIAPDPISLITLRTHQERFYPRGVIAIIAPWNFPVGIPAGGLAAALMAGNTVLVKPSEQTLGSGVILGEIFQAALQAHHLPPEIVQVALGHGETGAALLEQAIDGVIFTGSDAVGRKIRQRAGERGLWTSLELGGSDAMILLEGCDLELAASYALWGRFGNAGQACAAVKRLFVPARDEAELLRHLQDKIAHLRVGSPETGLHHIGPLISQAQRDRVDAQVQDAIAKGATCLIGGKAQAGPGWFYEPTLFSNVPTSARILTEEVFGPVLPVIPYQDVDAAIAQVNASPFGLTASLFGDPSVARALAGRLQCGTVVINDVGTSNFAMVCAPWGGWKESGTGSSHGERALLDLCKLQVVSENRMRFMPGLQKPMWQFSRQSGESESWRSRVSAVLAFCGRHPAQWNPLTWLAFWQHRASTKL